MTQNQVAFDRDDIAFERSGNVDNSAILLITGFVGVRSFWDPFKRSIPEQFCVVSYDQRGTGASGRYSHPLTMEQLADDAARLVQRLDLPPVHIIGHSMGACAAWIMAAKYPHLVASTYILAGWHEADPWMHRVFDVRLQALRDSGPVAYAKATSLAMNPPKMYNAHVEALHQAETAIAQSLPPLDELEERARAALDFRADEWHPQPSLPMRIACAADDWMTPIDLSLALTQLAPHSSFVELPLGGHYAPRTQSEVVAMDACAWISGHDQQCPE